ncbi:MAG: GntR family transcriptional regulator [Actinomycetota bacterium]|nr:GntR family transcriptional regulator [Actinomycetota bacterium]
MTTASQTKRVFAEFRTQLSTGAIPPGVRMSQTELAARFGVSRIPLREVLQSLAGEGLVQIDEGGAVTVTPLSIGELQEIYEIREVIEPLLTKISVPNIGRAEILRMRAVQERMAEATCTAEWVRLNNEFHGIPYAKAGRPRLRHLVEQYRMLADRYIFVLVEFRGATPLDDQHHEIMEAMADGDARLAAELTRTHLIEGHEFVLKVLLEQERAESAGSPPTL